MKSASTPSTMLVGSGHVRQDYRKLQNRDRRFQYAHESLKNASTPSTMLGSSFSLSVEEAISSAFLPILIEL